MTEPIEKRRYPRIPDRLSVRSASPDHGAAEMTTTNLSLGGACVVSRRFLPLMTRVEVTLHLPPESEEEARPRAVKAEAVVVRVEPARPGPEDAAYELALFFSRLEAPDRLALGRYLSILSRGR